MNESQISTHKFQIILTEEYIRIKEKGVSASKRAHIPLFAQPSPVVVVAAGPAVGTLAVAAEVGQVAARSTAAAVGHIAVVVAHTEAAVVSCFA